MRHINKEVYYDADKDGRFCFWGPKISFNPIDTLRKRHLFDILFPSGDGEIVARKPSDTTEDLLRKYYLLAVLHTNKGYGFPVLENVDVKCLDDSGNISAFYIWQAYEDSVAGIKDESKKRKLIETALNSVRQDIKNSLAEKKEPTNVSGSGENTKTGKNVEEILETTKLEGNPLRDQVFISYSHKDKRWLDDLQTHLKPYVRNGSVTAWSDKQIAPGSKWFPEIKTALASTKTAVLLVTPDFLASDFIHEHELGPLLKEAEKNNVTIIWIPVRACSYKETELKNYQAVIGPEKPLELMKAERNRTWVEICKEIKKAISSS